MTASPTDHGTPGGLKARTVAHAGLVDSSRRAAQTETPPPAQAEPELVSSSGSPSDIRVVVIDDHAMMRQGLRALLEREPDLQVVGEAGSVADARGVVARVAPDVVLIDLNLSGATEHEGLSLCASLAERSPGIGLLILTTSLSEDLVVRAVHAGARGYVVKDVDATELVRAIRAVADGDSAFDSASAFAVVRSLHGDEPAPELLTRRELDVLRLMAVGHSNREIGERLYVSTTTAKQHVSNVIRKLGAVTRAEAVYVATKRGVI